MATEGQQASQRRRRLLKAMSSAPVVMTLQSGSAMANTSAYQCLVNVDDQIPGLVPSGSSAGTQAQYVRETHMTWFSPRPPTWPRAQARSASWQASPLPIAGSPKSTVATTRRSVPS